MIVPVKISLLALTGWKLLGRCDIILSLQAKKPSQGFPFSYCLKPIGSLPACQSVLSVQQQCTQSLTVTFQNALLKLCQQNILTIPV